MTANVNLTRLSLSTKTVLVLVSLALFIGLLFIILWPSVSAVGHKIGSGLQRGVGSVTNAASNAAKSMSATEGMQ